MRETKFTMNALVLVVIIFSAITFFATVKMTDMADLSAVNQFYPVEGTNVAVKFSTLAPYGIYEGDRTNGVLKVEGYFGHDWGAAVVGNSLVINEYTRTNFGQMLSSLVRIDLNTYEKTLMYRDTMLRGKCASGELVCLTDFLMPNNQPATNGLCRLYAMSSGEIHAGEVCATVLYLDPDTGAELYRVRDDQALDDEILETRYLARTLEEVRG